MNATTITLAILLVIATIAAPAMFAAGASSTAIAGVLGLTTLAFVAAGVTSGSNNPAELFA